MQAQDSQNLVIFQDEGISVVSCEISQFLSTGKTLNLFLKDSVSQKQYVFMPILACCDLAVELALISFRLGFLRDGYKVLVLDQAPWKQTWR